MKLKTKHGELEGGQREIRNFFKSIDFDVTRFFQVEKKVSAVWILLPLFVYFVLAVVLVLMPPQNPRTIILLTFAALMLITSIVVGIHLRWKNAWLSSFIGFMFLITLPMLMGWVEPREAVKKLIDTYSNTK